MLLVSRFRVWQCHAKVL